VKVRKASGRSVAGGSSIGRTVDFATGFNAGGARIGAVLRALMGWAGVPNAGDEEGMRSDGTAEGFSSRFVVAITVIVCYFDSGVLMSNSTLRVTRERDVTVVKAQIGYFS
jgi:hypothetical protein